MRFLPSGEPQLEPGWTLVHVYVINGYGIQDQIDAMRRWLEDDARPGDYYWWAAADEQTGRAQLSVYLSDPDAAFEFKVRWG